MCIGKGVSKPDCPIKLKVCYRSCYWRKKGKCIFPPGGYDKWGQPVRKKNSAGD